MINIFKRLFTPKRGEKKDFSSFFNSASIEEKRRLMEEVARKANEDQRALLAQYERT